jgi:serine/threonine protein kinase
VFDAYLSAFPDLDTTKREAILLKIAQALEKLALHGIIHGDIKGDNVLMKENGEIVIIDLGLACDLKLPLQKLRHFGPADHFGFCCNLNLYGGYKDENRHEVIKMMRTLLPIASAKSGLGNLGDDILQCHLDELDAFVKIHGKFVFAKRDIYMLGILALYVMIGNWQKWFTELKTMYPTPENMHDPFCICTQTNSHPCDSPS